MSFMKNTRQYELNGKPLDLENFYKTNVADETVEFSEEAFQNILDMEVGDVVFLGGQGSMKLERVR